MAEEKYIKISEMEQAENFTGKDMLMITRKGSQDDGYSSYTGTFGQLSSQIKDQVFSELGVIDQAMAGREFVDELQECKSSSKRLVTEKVIVQLMNSTGADNNNKLDKTDTSTSQVFSGSLKFLTAPILEKTLTKGDMESNPNIMPNVAGVKALIPTTTTFPFVEDPCDYVKDEHTIDDMNEKKEWTSIHYVKEDSTVGLYIVSDVAQDVGVYWFCKTCVPTDPQGLKHCAQTVQAFNGYLLDYIKLTAKTPVKRFYNIKGDNVLFISTSSLISFPDETGHKDGDMLKPRIYTEWCNYR